MFTETLYSSAHSLEVSEIYFCFHDLLIISEFGGYDVNVLCHCHFSLRSHNIWHFIRFLLAFSSVLFRTFCLTALTTVAIGPTDNIQPRLRQCSTDDPTLDSLFKKACDWFELISFSCFSNLMLLCPSPTCHRDVFLFFFFSKNSAFSNSHLPTRKRHTKMFHFIKGCSCWSSDFLPRRCFSHLICPRFCHFSSHSSPGNARLKASVLLHEPIAFKKCLLVVVPYRAWGFGCSNSSWYQTHPLNFTTTCPHECLSEFLFLIDSTNYLRMFFSFSPTSSFHF